MTNKLLIIFILFFAPVSEYAQELPKRNTHQCLGGYIQPKEHAILLVLKTSKQRYRFNEPIEISVQLENVSQRGEHYYVGTDVNGVFNHQPLHGIEISVVDEKNRKIALPRGANDSASKSTPSTISEKLTQSYVWLEPGAFYGVRTEILNAPNAPLKPGRYLLTATYHESEALRWTDTERKTLLAPVWTQPLKSNTVTFTIVSRSARGL